MSFYIVRRRGAVLAGILASLALLLGGAAFVQLRAADSWSSMQRTVRALQAEWSARAHLREPLWGQATADRAFVHYERAIAEATALEKAHGKELFDLLPMPGDEQPSPELRAAWQPMLASLRAGAHATDVTPTSTPHADPKQVMHNLLFTRWLANCAQFEARALRRDGREREAVGLVLDSAALGADLRRGGVLIDQMIGAAILAIAVAAWQHDATLARLDRGTLDLLAQGLERLDASLPETLDMTSELLMCAWALQNPGSDEQWMPSAWRYGFSTRWMISEAFVHYATAAGEFADAKAAAWPQREAMFTLANEEAQNSANPLAWVVFPNLSSAESNARMTLTQIRMLRMAVDLHRGLDVPPLRDPLGDGPLIVKREANGVRLRSAGSTDQRKLERFVAR